jgi:tetrahydromethanopterin S-methyltransferase subunit G
MNRVEIESRIKELKKIKESLSDDSQKNIIQLQIDSLEDQLREIDKNAQNRTKGQKIGAGIGRLGGMMVGMVAGEIESCVTGKDIKKSRGTYAEGGENIGSSIGGVIEKIALNIKNRRKK